MSEKTRLLKIFIVAGLLWRRKWTIAAGTAVFIALGIIYALLAPPTYVVRAVIYPQNISARSDNSSLSGGLTGALNPLLGVSHLNRVEIVLKSREMARRIVIKQRLIPVLFPGAWDATRPAPAAEKTPMVINSGVEKLQQMVSTRVDVYKMTLTITARTGDPKLAYEIVQGYLEELNERTKENVIRNADANREFLETQLIKTADPWSREKIQELIVRETETAMLLNANAFDLLEAPEIPLFRDSPKRKKIVLVSALIGLLVSCVGVLAFPVMKKLRSDLEGQVA